MCLVCFPAVLSDYIIMASYIMVSSFKGFLNLAVLPVSDNN